jgi:putative transposase
MKLRAGERWNWKEAKKTLAESRKFDPALDQVYGKLLAEVYFRLDKAMQAFFKRVANGGKPGFPRVRPRHQFFTLWYPAAYLLFEGKRLILPTGGKGHHKQFPNIVATLAEVPPCGFREVAISRAARGHYHASFVYEAPEEEEQTGGVVAFDLGIKTLAVGYNGRGWFYHLGGWKRVSLAQQAARQASFQAGPLQKEVETLYPSLQGLPARLGTEAQQARRLSAQSKSSHQSPTG